EWPRDIAGISTRSTGPPDHARHRTLTPSRLARPHRCLAASPDSGGGIPLRQDRPAAARQAARATARQHRHPNPPPRATPPRAVAGYALPSSRIRRHSLILIDVLFSSCLPLSSATAARILPETGYISGLAKQGVQIWSRAGLHF